MLMEKKFIVTVYMNTPLYLGDVKVTAKDEEEAMRKVDLIEFFNLGYNGNLQKRVREIK